MPIIFHPDGSMDDGEPRTHEIGWYLARRLCPTCQDVTLVQGWSDSMACPECGTNYSWSREMDEAYA